MITSFQVLALLLPVVNKRGKVSPIPVEKICHFFPEKYEVTTIGFGGRSGLVSRGHVSSLSLHSDDGPG
jgi:hypothetical protein